MTHIIAIANNKGGTGKTKTTVQLATCYWRMGKAITVIDCDGQANATDELLLTNHSSRPSIGLADVLAGRTDLDKAIAPTFDWLQVVPSSGDLDDVADDLVAKPLGVLRLKNALDAARRLGDIVLIDCPPNVGVLTFSALIAADYVVIPTTPEPESLRGVERVVGKIGEVRDALGRAPVALGTIATMVRDTVRHREGLERLASMRPAMIGQVPFRGGMDSKKQLEEVYAPLAAEILRLIEVAQ